ncbi:MAG: fibronectin type III domain-containing protein [Pseudomonadota bacterium]
MKIKMLIIIFWLFAPFVVHAGPSITFTWDPSPDDSLSPVPSQHKDVNNYRLYWGPGSGNYNGFQDLGHVTSTVFTQLVPGGHYYFVVTCMNAEGAE